MHAWARVAEIVKTKTLDGGLVLRSSNGLPFLLEEGMEVAFVPPQTDCPRSARVCSVQKAKDAAYVVSFDTVEDIGTARALVGCSCLVMRDVLPLLGYDAARERPLEGFRVFDKRFGFLGTVEEVLDNPGQKLISVIGESGSLLIPFVDEFVKEVDEGASQVCVEVSSSLLDLAQPPSGGVPDRACEGGGATHED